MLNMLSHLRTECYGELAAGVDKYKALLKKISYNLVS